MRELDPVTLLAVCCVWFLAMYCAQISAVCCTRISQALRTKLRLLRNTVLSDVHCSRLSTALNAVGTLSLVS